MIPEFSIKHIKGDEIEKVRSTIENYTSVKLEEFILKAIQNEDLDSYVDALNAINYFSFKTILIMKSQIKILQKELKKYKN